MNGILGIEGTITRSPLSAAILGLLLVLPGFGCSHSESFGTGVDAVTVPFSTAPPVRLTYNAADNYWPSWTEDGRGIIYSYSYTLPDTHADDRCVGLLPPSGGTRLWQMCDERREHADSADSFTGVAIGTDGRLIYMEMSTRRGSGGLSGVNQPPQTRALWLADTAFPFQRRKLLDMSFGLSLNGIFFNALGDTRWLGSSSFIALAAKQGTDFNPWDSTLTGMAVVRGEITTAGVTLSIVPGTEGVQAYSLAENGVSLVIWRAGLSLERVPAAGGTATTVATLPSLPGMHITGLTCQATTCLVSASRSPTPGTIGLIRRAWRVSLPTGESVETTINIVGFPRISPVSTDIVGYDNITLRGSLFLYQGLLP